MGVNSSPDLDTSDEQTRCKRHPDVETGLLCGRCDTPICPRCLVQTPVGARCPDCANLRRLPTVDVKPQFLARGLAAAVFGGVLAGGIWAFVTGGQRLGISLVLIVIGGGIGWLVSEAVSLATNRKRGWALQWCAAFGVLLAYLVQNALTGDGILPQGGSPGAIPEYIIAVIGAAFAYSRLRP